MALADSVKRAGKSLWVLRLALQERTAASFAAQAGSRFVCTAAGLEGPPASKSAKQGNKTFRQVTTDEKLSDSPE